MTEKTIQRNGGNWRHGFSKTKTYASWADMQQRVNNPRNICFHRYGGRGITICERWLGKNGFIHFLADMGEKPTDVHEIDRKDNNGNYTPDNCHWTTDEYQRRNQERNHNLTYNNETMCLNDWGTRTGLGHLTIYKRLQRGWTVEDALTKPRRVTKLNAHLLGLENRLVDVPHG